MFEVEIEKVLTRLPIPVSGRLWFDPSKAKDSRTVLRAKTGWEFLPQPVSSPSAKGIKLWAE
ncbi:hypothetical protein [Roseobacter weihaiensis]|uniref:hypothetical protein n=1 Tax=Roseobacter weihaiensis TaxID=2763262 RepID=UPI001D0A0389|nr:hypothetical protein [Roseobacter sp. H9]